MSLLLALLFSPLATVVSAVALFVFVRSGVRAMRQIQSGREHAPVLEAAAHSLGRFSLRGSYQPVLNAALGGHRLQIEPDRDADADRNGLVFTVIAPKSLPKEMTIFSRQRRIIDAPLARTFDPELDAYFEITGCEPSDVAQLLDASIRNRLIALSAEGTIVIHQNRFVLKTHAPVIYPKAIERTATRMLDLARDLISEDSPPAARLLANAMSEPIPGARYQMLETLLRNHPGTREAEEAFRIAWEAPERGIKFLAASRRGEEGLLFLEETAQERTETISLRTMAMNALARSAPKERALPVLRRLLAARRGSLSRTAAELLGRLQDRESLAPLVALARASDEDSDLRAIVAHALGLIGDARAEDYLLYLLGDPSIEVRFAAVQALGKMGTPRALGKLARLAAYGAHDLSIAARSATSRIEARFGPIERGRLSLSAGNELDGSLSFHGGDGAISLVKDDGA